MLNPTTAATATQDVWLENAINQDASPFWVMGNTGSLAVITELIPDNDPTLRIYAEEGNLVEEIYLPDHPLLQDKLLKAFEATGKYSPEFLYAALLNDEKLFQTAERVSKGAANFVALGITAGGHRAIKFYSW